MNQSIIEARALANDLNREYRRKQRDEKLMDNLIHDIRKLLRTDGVLYKTRYGWKIKLYSGSDRDKRGQVVNSTVWVEGKPRKVSRERLATRQQPIRSGNVPEGVRPSVRATGRGHRHQHTNKKPEDRMSRPIKPGTVGLRQWHVRRNG
jgi:hypothetical protein